MKVLVPILFTEEVVEGIRKIVKNRVKMGISDDNNLVFACGKGYGRLEGWDVLQSVTKKLTLEKPKLITPTRTRKMVSTLMQLLDLTDGELTWITSHMGHTKDVQLAWYRKHDSTLELTKVARALVCVDQGSRSQLQNKKIGDLEIGIYTSVVGEGLVSMYSEDIVLFLDTHCVLKSVLPVCLSVPLSLLSFWTFDFSRRRSYEIAPVT